MSDYECELPAAVAALAVISGSAAEQNVMGNFKQA